MTIDSVDEIDYELEDYLQKIYKEVCEEARMARLPDCRLMTVRTIRGKGVYEYVSIKSGYARSKKGDIYVSEVRYPIIHGEVRNRKRPALPIDVIANEQLGNMNLPPDERTPDRLLEEVIARKMKV